MQIVVDLEKIRANCVAIKKICDAARMQTVWVTKGCHSHSSIVRVLAETGEGLLGTSRVQEFGRIRDCFSGQIMMTRFPSSREVVDTVGGADVMFVSDVYHVEVLSNAATATGQTKQVLLMIDVGNGREGVRPGDAATVVKRCLSAPGLELIGLGTSVGCLGGYRVGIDDLHTLIDVAKEVCALTGWQARCLSAGSGTMLLDLVRSGQMPPMITQLRIGAALLVGERPPTKEAFPFLHQDAFVFRGEILELGVKPPILPDRLDTDAFGKTLIAGKTEPRRQALMDFGVVDVDVDDLTPLIPTCRIVGASTDYTVCDVTACREDLRVGSVLEFRMAYSAIVRAMGSAYIEKVFTVNKKTGDP